MALIGIAGFLLLVAAMFLHAAPFYVVVLLLMFLVVMASILVIAFKLPQLVLMGGPELPPASKIAAVTDLLNPRPLGPEDRVIETDPQKPPIALPPAEIAKKDSEKSA